MFGQRHSRKFVFGPTAPTLPSDAHAACSWSIDEALGGKYAAEGHRAIRHSARSHESASRVCARLPPICVMISSCR